MPDMSRRGARAEVAFGPFGATIGGEPGRSLAVWRSDTAWWLAAAFAVELALAACVLVTLGAGERGISDALQVTGRFSFLLFWPAYVGGAAAALFGPTLGILKRCGRVFGLAFAAAHIVHLGLVVWLCAIGATPPLGTFVFFGVAVFWTYLLALASFGQLQQWVGPRGWRLLRFAGLNYIAYAFAVDFLRVPPEANARYVLGYLPFIVLAVVGPVLRVVAWALSAALPRRF
jgi:hypothetical protein